LYEVAGRPCFFTIRVAPGRSPFAEPRFAQIAVDCLLEQRNKSRCQVDVFCVMPDHVHLVVTPIIDGASSLKFVERYKGWCSRELGLAGWKDQVWQKRCFDHLVRAEDDLPEIAQYILANPVRKGLCLVVEEYPWSGIPEPIVLLETANQVPEASEPVVWPFRASRLDNRAVSGRRAATP
jgi:REP element-mobilizing transposase RayT